jgi:aspartyl-tRNA(Asn)/glutamyl-tRNA(Gln) amidotransferase subunit A
MTFTSVRRAAEAYSVHREALRTRGQDFNPRVSARLLPGVEISAVDHIDLGAQRAKLIAVFERLMQGFDALIYSTVPMLAPAMAPLQRDDGLFARTNMLMLRNPAIVNFLDGCGLSIPCNRPGDAPVDLMAFGPGLSDRRVLNAGLAIEQIVSSGFKG